MSSSSEARLPATAHTSRPWRIHELTRDFRLEDLWALPARGGPDDFPRLVQTYTKGDPVKRSSFPVRALFALRWKIGELLGWDDEKAGVGSRVPTLRDRLPTDLLEHPGPEFDALPGVEHLLEQRPAVLEVPVEAPLGDAQPLREPLDPDRVGATDA